MKQFILVAFLLLGMSSFAPAEVFIGATPIPPQNHGGRVYNTILDLAFTIHFLNGPYAGYPDNCHPEQGFWLNPVYDIFDHLVLANADIPDDPGRPLGRVDFEEWWDDGDGHIGTWSVTQVIDSCPPDTIHPDCCDYVWYGMTFDGEAHVRASLPNCGRWRIYCLLNAADWDYMCLDSLGTWPLYPTEKRVMMNLGQSFGCDYYENLVEYVESLSETLWAVTTVDFDTCTEVQPPDAKLTFNGYVLPDGGAGDNWLPEPGDSIGLAFHLSSASGQDYRISYTIWDVSMWKGECLNSPRFAGADPWPSGYQGPISPDSLFILDHWDFMLLEPEQYNLLAYDYLRTYVGYNPYIRLHRIDGGQTLPSPVEETGSAEKFELFETRLVATTPEPVEDDTLWLLARDYAAHCLVLPEAVAGGKGGFLRDFVSPYGDTLYSVAVPRDYDGFSGWYCNYGDGMADYWEQTEFSVTDTRPILPYVITPPSGPPAMLADPDTTPKGRNISGDYLCNFEEYRGAMVAVDCTDTWIDHRHQRLNPLMKTVFVHVRENVENETQVAMPGYVYKIPDAEIYFTDSIRWGPDATWDTTFLAEQHRNFLSWRDINFNKVGAGRWFVGYNLPTTKPVPDTSKVNAVTFWRFRDSPDMQLFSLDALAKTFGIRVFWNAPSNSEAYVPRKTSRCVVASERILAFQLNDYYQANPDSFFVDEPRVMSKVIAHEFGHAVGMHHLVPGQDLSTIMDNVRLENNDRLITSDSLYAGHSLQQFSIKGSHP